MHLWSDYCIIVCYESQLNFDTFDYIVTESSCFSATDVNKLSLHTHYTWHLSSVQDNDDIQEYRSRW